MVASVSQTSSTRSPSRRSLPEGWSTPERVEDEIVVDGLVVHRAGVSSLGPEGEEITGSAATLAGALASGATRVLPSSRAWFELLERASVVEAMRASGEPFPLLTRDGERVGTCGRRELFPESELPDVWRHARSNGVAIQRDWASACDRALWELAERDRVLASWHGHVRPEPIGAALDLGVAMPSYEWSAWSLPDEGPSSFSRGIDVVGVFGFPKTPGAPLAIGFGARPRRSAALEDAKREAIQLLSFLWGEPIAPPGARVEPTAMGHLDYWQPHERHALLRSWLAGEHLPFASADVARRTGDRPLGGAAVVFADLTPPWLHGSLRVARAVCAEARPLVFGEAPLGAHLPTERRIHPIS